MSEIKLTADSGGGTVSWKAPASTTGNAAFQLTLPANDGDANQYLQTNGSGALSWAAVSSAKILNRVYATTTTEVSVTSVTATDIGLSVNITPSATDSIIHIHCNTYILIHRDWSGTGAGVFFHRTISGSSSIIYIPKNASSETSGGAHEFGAAHSNNQAGGNQADDLQARTRLITEFYDTTHNTTSEITYKAQGAVQVADRNALADFHDSGAFGVLTVTEIAA